MARFARDATIIQNELRLQEHAAEQAMSENPKTTDSDLDIYQQNVVDYVEISMDDERQRILGQLETLSENRTRIENDIEGFSLREIEEAAKHRIVRLKAELYEGLDNAKKEEASALRTKRRFLFDNKLNREASYPDSLVFHWALVILAVLVESAVNAFFFKNISDMGLLGGLFQALFISFSNIGSALLMGIYVLPYKNHVDPKKQRWAKALITLYVTFIFIFNLMAAHYRTVIELNPLDAKMATLVNLIHDPLGINFEAWNLLIIGMLFVIVALIKGYTSDDVYPGYGEMDRKFKSATNHRGRRMDAMKTINRVIDGYSHQATESGKNAKQKISQYKHLIRQSEELVARFDKVIESSENLCNNLLWEYRAANVRIRATKPPAYFSQKHSFGNCRLELDLSAEKETCKALENRLTEIRGNEEVKLNDQLRRINEKALEDILNVFGNVN